MCVCGGRTQIIKGLAAFDKKCILFGSEKNVSVFTSDPNNDGFCPCPRELKCEPQSTLPSVVVEVAPPIGLDTRIVERRHCCCNCCMTVDAIPDRVRDNFDGNFIDDVGTNVVLVTLASSPSFGWSARCSFSSPRHYCIPGRTARPASRATRAAYSARCPSR